MSNADKIAVVVIHGMGEQRPMQTLRGFVQTLWQRDQSLFDGLPELAGYRKSDTWTKPDRRSGSAELRRITTARARNPKDGGAKGIRADFFELYWADVTADSSWSDFLGWFRYLLWRNPFQCEVPRRLLPLWSILWCIAIAIALSSTATALSELNILKDTPIYALLQWRLWGWVTFWLLVIGWFVKAFLTQYFGDVARYVTDAPRNINVRQSARERGLKLLRELHESGEYLRVIVVGHSLGSILAHDLVAMAWVDLTSGLDLGKNGPLIEAVQNCESAGQDLLQTTGEQPMPSSGPPRDARGCHRASTASARNGGYKQSLVAYRMAQRELFYQLAEQGVKDGQRQRPAWLISDLVTLGSPLSHAEFLIARNGCELRAMTRSREILRSPPIYQPDKKQTGRFTFRYSPSKSPGEIRMHHGAALASVRWTNIHDSGGGMLFLRGDVISGPVSQYFGPGVLDIQVAPRRSGWLGGLFPRLFTHTLYWDIAENQSGTPDHVAVLRNAVNVLDDEKAEQQLLARALPDSVDKRAK